MTEWQDIADAPLTEDYQDYIVWNGHKVCSAVIFEGQWIDNGHDFIDPQPTHFMPLPDAPA